MTFSNPRVAIQAQAPDNSRSKPPGSFDLSYVIAAYTVVIGTLVLYGLWLQAGRRAVAKQEAGLLAGRHRTSARATGGDPEADG